MELQLAIDLLNKEDAAELANKVKDYVIYRRNWYANHLQRRFTSS